MHFDENDLHILIEYIIFKGAYNVAQLLIIMMYLNK